METSYHARYLAGDTQRVWLQLIELGPAVYEEPVYSDALAVCREIVRRSVTNLLALHARLMGLGYEFAVPSEALVEAGPDGRAAVGEFEAEFGELPLIAREWYSTLASVNFTQAAGQREYHGREWPPPAAADIAGLGSHPVLIFQSLAAGRAMWQRMRAEADQDAASRRATGQWPDEPFEFDRFLPLGGWASNCDPIGFRLPSRGVDAVVFDDGGGDTYFVDVLRFAFQWGGFPFWWRSLNDPHYYSPLEYRPNFAAVLPRLREGLLDV